MVLRFLRRTFYGFMILLLLWLIAVQAGCLSMRTSDADFTKQLREKGQKRSPVFTDLSVAGRTVHTVSIPGPDTLPALLMVHGSPGSSDAFLDYLADTSLCKIAQLATLDRPGFGYSGLGDAEGSLSAQALAVKALADHISPGRAVFLIGHSLGAPIIARFAMDYPDRCAGLIFVAGSIDPELEPHPWWQKPIDRAPLKWFVPTSLWTSNHEIIPLEGELKKMLPLWERITCPVTVIHAENDRLVPFGNAAFAKRMITQSSRFEMNVLPDGDHFILWSRQDIVKDAIVKMLGG